MHIPIHTQTGDNKVQSHSTESNVTMNNEEKEHSPYVYVCVLYMYVRVCVCEVCTSM